jgi:two-component system, NarL family, invasion response regulator UvrY
MIKVLLVDDHDLVRHGIKTILHNTPDIKVVGEATTGEQAITLSRELNPEIILMDVKMEGIGGLEAIRRISRQDNKIKIIAVSSLDNEPYPSRTLQAGASGYISKSAKAQEMIDAIHAVSLGKKYISADIAQRIALSKLEERNRKSIEEVSEREMQVMIMITTGKKVSDIAETLHLSPKTVNSYRYRLFEKLGVNSDVELTHLAIKHGIIETKD